MADSVSLKVIVTEDGFVKLQQQASKAKTGIDGVSTSTDNYNKKQKGAAQATSNSTKAFSKMQQGMTSGLVPAYAVLASNVFALSAAFEFLKKAADVKNLQESQRTYAANTGLALQSITRRLKEASQGMLGFRESAEAAAIGVAKGFSPKQLEDLAIGAQKASTALGRGFQDSFDRLLRGASKAEPELLDELGITLRLADATEKYGQAIGKNAKELTAAQRSQAVLVETQRQLNELFGEGDAIANPFVQLGKTFEGLVRQGTNAVLPLLSAIADILNRSAGAAIAVIGMFSLSIVKAIIPFDSLNEKLEGWRKNSIKTWAGAKREVVKYRKELKTLEQEKKRALALSSQTLASQSGKVLRSSTIGNGDTSLFEGAAAGNLTSADRSKLDAALKGAEAQILAHNKITEGIFKGASARVLRNYRTTFDGMNVRSQTFFQKQKVRWKVWSLNTNVALAKVKAAGSATFLTIGKAAAFAGRAMSKAFRIAGIIGIFILVWQGIQKIIEAPFTFAVTVLSALDSVFNAMIKGVNWVAGTVGKILDKVGNAIAVVLNLFIDAFNKVASTYIGKKLGLSIIEPLDTASTNLEEKLSNLVSTTSNLAEAFKGSDLGKTWLGKEIIATNVKISDEALKGLLETTKTLGKDFNNVISGMENPLRSTTQAQKDLASATFLGSAGISDQLFALGKTVKFLDANGDAQRRSLLDEEQRAKVIKSLTEELEGLSKISPAAAKALQGALVGGDAALKKAATDIQSIELTARDATSSMRGFRDEIAAGTQQLKEGNLSKLEDTLVSIQKTAKNSAEQFSKLGFTAQQIKLLEEYNTSITQGELNLDGLLGKVQALRVESEAIAVAQALSESVVGGRGDRLSKELAIRAATLEIDTLEFKLKSANEGADTRALQLQIKLLNIKKQGLEVDRLRATSGDFAADARSGFIGRSEEDNIDPRTLKLSEQTALMGNAISPMLETLKGLGPQGEAMGQAFEGALSLTDTFSAAFDTIKDKGLTLDSALNLSAQGIQAMGDMFAGRSKMAIAGIDSEIAAEKKRDGQSASSLAKIAGLEAKKEKMKRKAFETDKKMKIGMALMGTAQAVTNALGSAPFPFNFVLAGLAGVMGMAQVAAIKSTSYSGGGGGGGASTSGGATALSIGQRSSSIDIASSRSVSGELGYLRGGSGTGGPENFRPAFTGTRAAGGNTASYMVGEQGPELFVPEVPGKILPADESKNTGNNVTANFTIQALDSTGVEEVLNTQAGTIINMLRTAANSYGETFIESVDTATLSKNRTGAARL